ncbi:uncharacterized protein LOC121646454 isoform X2 [Melanotaenia boesemani]|uniref:uncharacterized protein LOC121646454 isoform X2 n=1 Tax=Melanotaenia boesemani TaxID=1250792 RepID=UPI001C0518CD|nr:uncharacterized protein LOC121646454 isoform X2 [Melanotaenia boesemani]
MQRNKEQFMAVETFSSQTELIMEVAVEYAVSVLQRLGQEETAGGHNWAQLTSVLTAMSREASRNICSIFRELYGSMMSENKALKDKVSLLECEKPQKPCACSENQVVHEIQSNLLRHPTVWLWPGQS